MVKITVDTKEDSHEEIKKVIKMLSAFVGENPLTNQANIFEDSSPAIPETNEPTNAFANMFGGESQPPTSELQSQEETETDDDSDDTPEVIEYE